MLAFISDSVFSASIDVAPNLFAEITAAQLLSIGGDFPAEMHHLLQPWQLHVRDTGGAAWRVYVHQVASDWPWAIALRIRTETGPWLSVDQTEKLLASGAGDRSDIRVFFSIANASVSLLSVGEYHAQWQYRIEIHE